MSGTAMMLAQSLASALNSHAALPAATAADCDGHSHTILSYRDLAMLVSHYQQLLCGEQTSRSPTPVGLLFDRDLSYLVGVLAAALTGICFLPLSTSWLPQRLRASLQATEPALILHTDCPGVLTEVCKQECHLLQLACASNSTTNDKAAQQLAHSESQQV